jgi:hypothetical protein
VEYSRIGEHPFQIINQPFCFLSLWTHSPFDMGEFGPHKLRKKCPSGRTVAQTLEELALALSEASHLHTGIGSTRTCEKMTVAVCFAEAATVVLFMVTLILERAGTRSEIRRCNTKWTTIAETRAAMSLAVGRIVPRTTRSTSKINKLVLVFLINPSDSTGRPKI